ncbi:MAG: DUF393 domain-containing protein [Verrucomicrobiae bacterium]|nr:DUF393 domain-containing protein [Verrucomicrobiae bacterium]
MSGPLLLYDGECGLCHGFVRFVLRWERVPRIRFAPLQSAVGREWSGRAGSGLETVLFVEGDALLQRSDAALAVARHLRAPWCWLRFATVLPRGLRNAAYDVVARHRFSWFGKASCALPSPEQRGRFLE